MKKEGNRKKGLFEEEGFVGKEGFGGEEDNIKDIVVVANDICSSMIQTTLSVDVEEDVNTKSHVLMSFGKGDTSLDATSYRDGVDRRKLETSFSQAREDDAEALTFSQIQNA
ncbi:hypothetical protein Tco_0272259 [Tanacetum coccineum]